MHYKHMVVSNFRLVCHLPLLNRCRLVSIRNWVKFHSVASGNIAASTTLPECRAWIPVLSTPASDWSLLARPLPSPNSPGCSSLLVAEGAVPQTGYWPENAAAAAMRYSCQVMPAKARTAFRYAGIIDKALKVGINRGMIISRAAKWWISNAWGG